MSDAASYSTVEATGVIIESGAGTSVAVARRGDLNVSLWGSFVATVTFERSFDGGETWLPLTYIDGTPLTWSGPGETTLPGAEVGTLVRLACAWTSGVVEWRINQ